MGKYFKHCDKCNVDINYGLYLTKCPFCKSVIYDKSKNVKLKEVVIEGLFNKFNHKLEIDVFNNIAVLTAPNGVGKSTIFKFIDFLLSPSVEKFKTIKRIPVKKFQCKMSDDTKISYKKISDTKLNKLGNYEVIEHLKKRSKDIVNHVEGFSGDILKPLTESMVNENLLFDHDFFEDYCYTFSVERENKKSEVDLLKILEKTYHEENKDLKETIENAKQRIIDEMLKISGYRLSHIKTTRIQEFPLSISSVSSMMNSDLISVGEINDEEEVNKKIKKWIEFLTQPHCMTFYRETLLKMFRNSFLRKGVFNNPQLSDDELRNLCNEFIYDFNHRTTRFSQIFNSENNITGKVIDFSPREGFVITQNKKLIFPDHLSSGEKHLFSIYFEFIFNLNQSTIFLIDEPEISLHIEWQEHLIRNLKRIVDIDNIQIIIATHSPNILIGNTELLVKKEVSDVKVSK